MENKESKAGVKTTEFWIAIAPVLMGMMESMKGDTQNNSLIIICGTCLAAMYMASRTIVKYMSLSKTSSRSSK